MSEKLTPGHLIKSYRERHGIRQDEMALACKIGQANLSAIENGSRSIGPSVALKLAAFMGVSPIAILFPNGYEAEPDYLEVKERATYAAKLSGRVVRSPTRAYAKSARRSR